MDGAEVGVDSWAGEAGDCECSLEAATWWRAGGCGDASFGQPCEGGPGERGVRVGGDDGEVVVGDERFELRWPGAGEGGDEWTFDECRGSPERFGCGRGLGWEGEPGEPAARRGGQAVRGETGGEPRRRTGGGGRAQLFSSSPACDDHRGRTQRQRERGGQRSGVRQ